MPTVCTHIAENSSWKTGFLSDDIAAILSCKAVYLHPKWIKFILCSIYKSFKLIFNAIFYCKQVYFKWEKWVQWALTLQSNIFCTGIPLGQRLYRKVHTVCLYITGKARWNTDVLSNSFYVQYTRVSSLFLMLYYIVRKCIIHGKSA